MVLRLFVRDIVFYHILFTYFSLTSTYFSRFLPCSGDDNNAIGFPGRADLAPTVAMTKFAYSTYVTPSARVTLKRQPALLKGTT